MKNENTCRICKRILLEDSKLGLCPDCFNKYGSIAVVPGVITLGVVGKFAYRNGKKLVKNLPQIIEFIKGL